MADPQDSPLVRAPLQERSRKTLERILAAGWTLLEEGGPDALTVQAITRRARTSVGSFYARFQGKDDLLRYMGEDALDKAITGWTELKSSLEGGESEADSGDGLRATLEPAVHGLGELYLSGEGRDLAFMEGIEDAAPSRRRRLEDRVAKELAGFLPGDGLRTELAVRVLTGTLHDAAVRARSPRSTTPSPYPVPDLLLSELVELLTGYLGGEVRPPQQRDVEAPTEEEADATADVSAETPEDGEQAASDGAATPPDDSAAPPAPDPFEVWG
ncbi:MAG: TetR/AcrR family transcriptional regulator [Gemmatimonadota bacterium]